MARPHKEIDQKSFENLCGLQCTLEEICGFFDVTDKTGNGEIEKAKKIFELFEFNGLEV